MMRLAKKEIVVGEYFVDSITIRRLCLQHWAGRKFFILERYA
jgi:hypothetical protein